MPSMNIREDELSVLAYLHEVSTGYDYGHSLPPAQVREGSGLESTQFAKSVSFLEQLQLVGTRKLDQTSFGDAGPVHKLVAVWLTGPGEDYMRELEDAPGVARRITVGVVKEMGDAIRSVAIGVLTEFAKRSIWPAA